MSFLHFAESHGLIMRQYQPDGRVHRVPTVDHPKKANGAYSFDGVFGWCQNWAVHQSAIVFRVDSEQQAEISREELRALISKRNAERLRDERRAAERSIVLLNAAKRDNHPYLAAKGFPDEIMLVHEGALLVPMWDCAGYGKRLNSAQKIQPDGAKKFMPGAKAKGSIYKIGSGAEIWLCEGLATGLSIRDALKAIYRQATVVVCFSAGNLAHVAQSIPGIVVADNDASGTGERVARQTGLRWWMPPDVDTDANDFHQRYGVRNLAAMLNKTRAI